MPKPQAQTIPVAIAGGGPVGLLLALFLDRYGVRSVIFNSEPQVRRHPKGSTHNARTMEHHRRLGIRRGSAISACRSTADRRELLHQPDRLGARPHPHAVGGRQAARGLGRRRDRPDARAPAARQPDVRRGVPARARPHPPEHHDPLRLAGRQVRRRCRGGCGRHPNPAISAKPGARNIWPAATAGAASCAARWRFATTASRRSIRRTMAAA